MTINQDVSRKFANAEASYREVLDATKHQDDKIGRIVTAVAFLTAASLTLANMTGVTLTRRFVIDGNERPLLAYAVGAFVLGVVVSVVLLLGSITTNLTLPGRPKGASRDRNSLIYFQSIVKHETVDGWRARWDADADSVERDLFDDYVEESFNLARRTSYKYWRTNEAAAVLSFALFCLGAAVVLACGIAAMQPATIESVPFSPALRWVVGGYAAAYTFVIVRVARLDEWIRRHEIEDAEADRRDRELAAVQTIAPLAVAVLVLADSPVRRALAGALLVSVAAILAMVLGVRARDRRALAILAAIGVACLALWPADDVWRLLAAVGVPVLLTAYDIVVISGKLRPPPDVRWWQRRTPRAA